MLGEYSMKYAQQRLVAQKETIDEMLNGHIRTCKGNFEKM